MDEAKQVCLIIFRPAIQGNRTLLARKVHTASKPPFCRRVSQTLEVRATGPQGSLESYQGSRGNSIVGPNSASRSALCGYLAELLLLLLSLDPDPDQTTPTRNTSHLSRGSLA